MSSRWPSRSKVRSRYRYRRSAQLGEPRFSNGDVIHDFTVTAYLGHSDINKRNSHIMAKPQHWYTVQCSCGNIERRSQQELIDDRRTRACADCRQALGENTDEDGI